ncbi:methylmalonyl-CoA mutase family protein [Skermania piniformis]|uniref:Methylmalonyl-CoA mutase n=2 Tax=Skermania pinensis TaxID=39122 RepID=A0ABX8S3R1_9ACTN|nr:methylmalonyl-CoA mutase family protein [Skermania piniformis]QXQ12358.1 methylmalonyl-CoA mutase [Skermania piniformis]
MSSEATTAGYAQWRQAVAGVLAKARRVDPAELPEHPEELLAAATYDGVPVAPLYTRADERAEQPLPGTFPFVRGGDGARDPLRGWRVSARFAGADPTALNTEILTALNNGVSAIWLATAPDAISTALDGVLFDLVPVTLAAGPDTATAAALLDVAPDRADVQLCLGTAPLTSTFAGVPDVDLRAAVELATRATRRTARVRTIVVDGTAFHDAGAADSEELGAAAAAGLEYLRALTGAGMTIGQALGQLEFRFAATDDQFRTIAKFRAGRQIWARISQVCGASDAGNAPQHAVSSAAMLTTRDPWVNLLRGALAAFGAGIGGADTVTVLPFDAALAPGALDVTPEFAARMARNTQLLLLEESHLGRVADPAAGSWFVEDLTATLAAQAWAFLQRIEAAGGYQAALGSGVIGDVIGATAATRADDIAHRRTAVTGVNEFPNLAEPAQPADAEIPLAGVARYGAAFEALRDRSDKYLATHGARPQAVLIPLGPVAEHTARVTFATNLLASGGIETVDPGPLTIDDIASAATESGAAVAVVCGSDRRYGAEAAPATAALRAAGVGTVLLAGPEKAFGTAEPRPDGFLTLRIDAVSTLAELLTKAGA